MAITPYLLYEDVAAALDWLAGAFGFEEELRFTEPGGTVSHAEMATGGGRIMLGHPGPDYRSPERSGQLHSFLHIDLDDVDRHYQRAVAAGARIIEEPQDKEYGSRSYRCLDPEGHRWDFGQQIREVRPEEWGATSAGQPR